MANIPTDISNYIIPKHKHDLAVAELVLFSAIHVVQYTTRFIQERRYWHHRKRKSIPRCVLYSCWSMIGILAQFRIAGSVLVISNSRPGRPMLIAETILQGIGLSPLLFEVSLVLLRCGQSGQSGPGKSKYPTHMRFMLHFFRFPVIISITLALVGSCVGIRPCIIAGTAVFVGTFVFVWCLVGWMAVKTRKILSAAGYRSVLIVLSCLPFLTVRITYFVLSQYGAAKFSPVTGAEDILVGMSVLMEIIAVILLFFARAVAEPFLSVGTCDVEVV